MVILDKNKYTEKYLSLLNSEQFKKSEKDPSAAIEGKIQRALRKIKLKLHVCFGKFPTGSIPGKLYGTAKVHKMKTNNVEELPLRPIISNVGTASCKLGKYLAKLLYHHLPVLNTRYFRSNSSSINSLHPMYLKITNLSRLMLYHFLLTFHQILQSKLF